MCRSVQGVPIKTNAGQLHYLFHTFAEFRLVVSDLDCSAAVHRQCTFFSQCESEDGWTSTKTFSCFWKTNVHLLVIGLLVTSALALKAFRLRASSPVCGVMLSKKNRMTYSKHAINFIHMVMILLNADQVLSLIMLNWWCAYFYTQFASLLCWRMELFSACVWPICCYFCPQNLPSFQDRKECCKGCFLRALIGKKIVDCNCVTDRKRR